MTTNNKILVVDDDAFIRELLADVLQSNNFLVETAEDGNQAIKKLNQNGDYHLLISDLEMPGMHGIELINQLRQSGNDTPIVVLTGNKDISTALNALQSGANEYVIKDETIGDSILSAVNSALERKRLLDENERLIQNLIQAKEEAEKANKAKSDFLAKMSHDLKTPLNAIMGFTQMVLTDEEENLNQSIQDSLNQIDEAGNHLLDLINDLLDLAAIEAGKMKVVIEDIDLISILKESLILIKPSAMKREIEIIDETAEHEFLKVAADSLRLKQVLLNLLSNGIKYNSKGGTLSLTLEKRADRVCIHVRDTGCGIPPDQITALFDSFNRLGAEKSGVEGTGIGLNICKNLIDLMGGALDVQSTVGKGSCFSITIPLGGTEIMID